MSQNFVDRAVLRRKDPLDATRTIFHFDQHTGMVTIEEQQDVTGIVEGNKRLQNTDYAKPTDEVRLEGRIPHTIYAEMQMRWRRNQTSWEDRQTELRNWMNNPDNRLFRTSTRKV